MCELGNAFPPSRSSLHHHFTRSESYSHISADEDWFAVDASNNNIRANAEELARAYHNFYYAAKARLIASRNTTPAVVSSQSRAWWLHPVQRETQLYHTLCSASGDIVRSVAPTLYLNIILCHCRQHYQASGPSRRENDVFRCMLHRASRAKTIVALVWILLTDPDSYRLHHPQSAWLLNRLLRVEYRLSLQLQRSLKVALIQFLLTDEVEHLESSWLAPEKFRAAIMADLNLQS